MANEQNLMPIELVNSRRTREQHSEDSRRAGIKSGESRRKKRKMRERVEFLLSLPFPDNLTSKDGRNIKETMKMLGMDDEDLDNGMAITIAMYNEALKGNVKASTFLRDTSGEKPIDKVEVTKDTDEAIKDMEDYLCKKKKS